MSDEDGGKFGGRDRPRRDRVGGLRSDREEDRRRGRRHSPFRNGRRDRSRSPAKEYFTRNYEVEGRDREGREENRDSSPQHRRFRRHDRNIGGGFQRFGGQGNMGGGPWLGAMINARQKVDPYSVDTILSFKEFLETQETNINEDEAVRRFSEYKENFQRNQAKKFFELHKNEEWFREKYHPVVSKQRQEEQIDTVQSRASQFAQDLSEGKYDVLSLDLARPSDDVPAAGDEMETDRQQEGIDIEEEGALPDTAQPRESEVRSVPIGATMVEENAAVPIALFIKSIPPNVTRQQLVELCAQVPGFRSLSMTEANASRKFHRLGWVSFADNTNVDEALQRLNNAKIGDFEFHFVVHRQPIRTRTAQECFATDERIRSDLEQVSKLVKALDEERQIECPFSAPMERESLPMSQIKDALDRLVIYLRKVHLFCYYCGIEYDNEEELLRKCGKSHLRSTAKVPERFQEKQLQWLKTLDQRIQQRITRGLDDESIKKLGAKDVPTEIENYLESNTIKVEEEKYRCALCSKLFKGPEFVRKHLMLKHEDNQNEVKNDVAFYNSFLRDPLRPTPAPTQPFGFGMQNRPGFVQSGAQVVPQIIPMTAPGAMGFQGGFGQFQTNVPVMPMFRQFDRPGFQGRGGGRFHRPGKRFGRFHPYNRPPPLQSGQAMSTDNLPPPDPRGLRTYVDLDAPPENDTHLDYRNEGL